MNPVGKREDEMDYNQGVKLVKSGFIKGNRFWYLPNDNVIGQRIALNKYEPYLTQLFLSQIDEGQTVVDVGANIGYDTVLFSQKVGENGKVYAIEPDPISFEILQKNVFLNNLKNVSTIQAAVGSNSEGGWLYRSEDNLGDHRMFGANLERKKVKVGTVKLDDYLKKEKVSFIKIDTQGWEGQVIEGARNIIKTQKPTIFFEYWPWAAEAAKLDEEAMIEYLREIYGKIYYIDEYTQVYYPVSHKWLKKHYPKNDDTKQCNLWVNSNNLKIRLGQYKNFLPKKWLKRKLGYPLT